MTPDLAGRAGITFCRMAGALFVAHEDILDIVLLEDFVIDRQNRAAWITEDVFDAIVLERPQHDLRACHLIAARLIIFSGHAFVPLSTEGSERVKSRFRGIKKGSWGSLSSNAWVAIAGWLHHPAHALSTTIRAVEFFMRRK